VLVSEILTDDLTKFLGTGKLSLCCVSPYALSKQPSSSHTFQLLSKHGISPCTATLCEYRMKQMPRRP